MEQTRTGGVGILGVFTIVFLVLKVGHVVTWPWVIVLAPIWVPVLLAGLVRFGSWIRDDRHAR